MDLSSTLKTHAETNRYHKSSRNVIKGRISKHQLLASLNASDKSVTHSLKLPCMNIKGSKKNEFYTFELKLYLSFKISEPSNYIALSITNKNDVSIKLSVEACLEKRDSSKEQFGKYSCLLDKDEERRSYFLKEKLMKDPSTYLPNGEIVIICDLSMQAPNAGLVDGNNNGIDMCACKSLALQYAPETCFDPIHGYSDELSDFTINVENCSFKCHKAILSSRSEVFRHMFLSNMKEAQSDKVSIYDMNADTISNLLIFMYTDNLEPKKITIQLLGAADKYLVTSLKEMCEIELSQKVTVDNVCEYWYAAYLHRTLRLQETAVEFMASNLSDIKDTPEFQELEIKIPEVMKHITSLLSDAFKI